MQTKSQLTKSQSKEKAAETRAWHIVDAEGITLGRLASEVAVLLRGKHKPVFTRHTDCGDFVIVVNAAKIKVTGKKLSDKIHYQHTGFIGHMKAVSTGDLLKNKPEKLVELAVFGMLPKGVLGHHMRKKLKVYAGTEHPHKAQTPAPFVLKYARKAA